MLSLVLFHTRRFFEQSHGATPTNSQINSVRALAPTAGRRCHFLIGVFIVRSPLATRSLSPGLAFETTCGTACASHSASVVTWNIGDLAAMTTGTCSFPVRLLRFGDLQLEGANVSGDQSDPNPGNNGAITAVLLRMPVVIPALDMIGLLLLAMLLGLTAIVRKGIV